MKDISSPTPVIESAIQTEVQRVESPTDCSLEQNILDTTTTATSNIKIDIACQVFICENDEPEVLKETFVCVKYVNQDHVDVEIQTDISGKVDIMKVKKTKIWKHKSCNTEVKAYANAAVGPNEPIDVNNDLSKAHKCFQGYSSINNDEELLDLTGVSRANFEFLLKLFEFPNKIIVSKEDRVCIMLMKIKTGLTFSAIGALFRIHRTTVAKIFFSCLEQLRFKTTNLVYWPDQEAVRASTPGCFKPDYSDTRVILDCTEFRIETPSTVENRVFCYSHYKHGFTFKVLFGITPSGFISFKSNAYGGRISDSHITVDSGIIKLLEHGDKILADKGFPEVQSSIDKSGKKIILLMPPFLKNKGEFSQEETEDTYKTARLRIHVERIMQRLRTYRVLDKIPEYLFTHMDDIIHICSVLVNLQPPIISTEKTNPG